MKTTVTTLKIHNIGLIADETIQLNKPLILLYGDVRQGKTTFLNSIRWVFGGKYPSDIIKHGAKEASIELGIDGGSISRSFYVSKSGKTEDRPVVFIRNGKPVSNPVSELKKLFVNPFSLNQDYLREMNEPERKAFLLELLGVDTDSLDSEAATCATAASALRSKLTGYGNIDLTKVEPVDATQLKSKLSEIRSKHAADVKSYNDKVASIRSGHAAQSQVVIEGQRSVMAHNASVDREAESVPALYLKAADLRAQIQEIEAQIAKTEDWLSKNPKKAAPALPETPAIPQPPDAPNTSDLETAIQNAAANEVRLAQYKANLKREEDRQRDAAELKRLEDRQRQIKAEKSAKLKSISDNCKIKGLSFDELGGVVYEDTQAGMLSTSQIMRLSSELSGLYPEGFGIELLDRGESLGRAIFDYVDHAKKTNSTVIATVVGQRPAVAPEQVGVFVIKDGAVFTE